MGMMIQRSKNASPNRIEVQFSTELDLVFTETECAVATHVTEACGCCADCCLPQNPLHPERSRDEQAAEESGCDCCSSQLCPGDWPLCPLGVNTNKGFSSDSSVPALDTESTSAESAPEKAAAKVPD